MCFENNCLKICELSMLRVLSDENGRKSIKNCIIELKKMNEIVKEIIPLPFGHIIVKKKKKCDIN